MRFVRNNEGIALITALMFTLIILVIIMGLLQYIMMGSKMSAAQKKYRNSLEASYGGVELITKEILPKLITDNYAGNSSSLLLALGGTTTGKIDLTLGPSLQAKLENPTASAAWTGLSKTINAKESPDMQFKLRGTGTGKNFNVYGKIVDSVPGNSDISGVDYLGAGAGVAGSGAGIAPQHLPGLYTIEVQGEVDENNPKEKAKLSVLYAF
jgi:Tfp pilus assembly protein PilX